MRYISFFTCFFSSNFGKLSKGLLYTRMETKLQNQTVKISISIAETSWNNVGCFVFLFSWISPLSSWPPNKQSGVNKKLHNKAFQLQNPGGDDDWQCMKQCVRFTYVAIDDDDGKQTKKQLTTMLASTSWIMTLSTCNMSCAPPVTDALLSLSAQSWCLSPESTAKLYTQSEQRYRGHESIHRVFFTLWTHAVPLLLGSHFAAREWHLFFQYQRSLFENVFSENTLCLGHRPQVTQLKIRNLLAPSAGFWQPFQDACTVDTHARTRTHTNHFATKWLCQMKYFYTLTNINKYLHLHSTLF